MTEPSDNRPGNPFTIVNLDDVPGVDVAALHALVLSQNGRVEITRGNGRGDKAGSCVLISKRELESLEEALEILSNTEMVRAMRDELATVARLDTPRAAVPAQASFPSRVLNLP